MLTRNDVTVPDARRVFAEITDLPVPFVGFKDVGLPVAELKSLVRDIRANGQKVMLEVVSETQEDELSSIRAGLDIAVDYILGGTHADDGVRILERSGIGYMPFPGRVVGHPSTLRGTPAEVVDSARSLSRTHGVAGLDLLAYRHGGDAEALIADVLAAVACPVVIAGSIASVDRIHAVCRRGPWGFTIGSAVFDHAFADEKTVRAQITAILAALDRFQPDDRKPADR